MASDNSVMSPGSGGDTIRDFADGSGVKWPACAVCYVTGGSAGAWTLSSADTNTGNATAATQRVVLASNQPAVPVTGTFWQATQPVSGTVTANVGTGSLAGITGTVTVQGGAASGAAAAGNPVQVGAAFNTTQPTVTNGQAVQLQATARGALIVGTGVDTFHATLDNATLAVTQSGTWNVGTVTTVSTVSTLAQLPAAAALADNLGNPTTTEIGANLLGWDATNSVWRRVQVDAGTGTVKVDGSGATQPVSGTVTANQGGAPWSENVTQFGGSAVVTGTGAGGSGIPRVTVSNDSNVLASQSGAWTVQPGNTQNTTPWLVSDQAAAAGGTSVSSFLSTAAVQSTAVKASAGQVYALHFFNLNAAAVYVRLYNQTTAPASTDTANIVYRALIPGNTAGAGFVVPIPPGVVFSTGIGLRVTAAVADNDNTALAASTVLGNVFYK